MYRQSYFLLEYLIFCYTKDFCFRSQGSTTIMFFLIELVLPGILVSLLKLKFFNPYHSCQPASDLFPLNDVVLASRFFYSRLETFLLWCVIIIYLYGEWLRNRNLFSNHLFTLVNRRVNTALDAKQLIIIYIPYAYASQNLFVIIYLN